MSSNTITNEEIKRIALENGFTTRRQVNGNIDLNPYVYDFARALLHHDETNNREVIADLDQDKPTIAVDFDGVLHRYNSGWQGIDIVADDPVDGAMRFLTDAVEKFNVCIYSTRSMQAGGIEAMWSWLRNHLHQYWEDLPETADKVLSRISFPTSKPKAVVYLDDRAYRFTGEFPDVDDLLDFKPWNKTL